jgi:hypothetical protein
MEMSRTPAGNSTLVIREVVDDDADLDQMINH